MKHNYFVSYVYVTKWNNTGYGNTIVQSDNKLNNAERIQAIERRILQSVGAHEGKILYINDMGVDE